MTLPGPEIIKKMPSVLNISNGSSKSEEFSLNDIEVLVDSEEQNCFKRAHTGQYLGIARIITLTSKLSEEEIRSWPSFRLRGVWAGGSIVWTPLGNTLRVMIFSSR